MPAYNALLGRILTTKDANAALPGKANIYVGSTQLPYYLTAANDHVGRRRQRRCAQQLLAGIRAAPGSVHQHRTAQRLTMFNPAPAATSTVTVPLLVTVPNATSACGGVMPAGGWPVVIVQHGITGDRSQALAMADSLRRRVHHRRRHGPAAARHHVYDEPTPVCLNPAGPAANAAVPRRDANVRSTSTWSRTAPRP